MKVLVTNDDGVDSKGLFLLKDLVLKMGFSNITVVAPKENKTASSHSVSLERKIEIQEIGTELFAVDGTPSDCVMVAFDLESGILDKKPDIVFSGVNVGSNLGIDVLHSGTIAAATQGMLYGVPSFAISQSYVGDKHDIEWNVHSEYLERYLLKILDNPSVLSDCLLNINLPSKKICGIKHLPQYSSRLQRSSSIEIVNHSLFSDPVRFVSIDTTGSPHFCPFLDRGYITVTPVSCDVTHFDALELLISYDSNS